MKKVVLTIICLTFTGCFKSDVDKLLETLTTEQKVGQMFMVGNLGRQFIKENLYSSYHIGNVFLGYEDINHLSLKRISKLTAKINELAKLHNRGIGPFIATDQEGGRVNRVKKAAIMPSNQFIARNISVRNASVIAQSTAVQLKALGINVNFAPVVDVKTNRKAYIAKHGRVFSRNAKEVSKYGIAFLQGFSYGGIIGCLKHFPGYGHTAPDPHKTLPTTEKTYEQMQTCELLPYKDAIKAKAVDMIMTAHIAAPKLTGDESIPATVSHRIMQDILRGGLKYKGVVITDDLNMGAMSTGVSANDHAVECINAGVDILLFVGKPRLVRRVWKAVFDAAQSGKIPGERLDEAVRRILRLKYKYNLIPVESDS